MAALVGMLDDTPPSPEALAMVRAAVQTFLHHKGRLSLDRCFKVPTPANFLRAERDRHITEALRAIAGPSDRARAMELRRMLLSMSSSGCWNRWRQLDGVPSYATTLQRCCHEVLSHGPDASAPYVPSERLLRQLASEIR